MRTSKFLLLGNEKKNKFSFCIFIISSHSDIGKQSLHVARLIADFPRLFTLNKLLPLGNEKKNKFSFCISLAYS